MSTALPDSAQSQPKQSQPGEPRPTKARSYQMQEADLLRLAVEVLHKAFHDCSRIDAKRRYRVLEAGKRLALTELRNQYGEHPIRVTLELERTDLRGNLNFTLLRGLTGRLIARALAALRQGGPYNTFSDEHGRTIYLLPAVGGLGEHVNVMAIGVNCGRPDEICIELTFLDPDQFKKEQAEAASA